MWKWWLIGYGFKLPMGSSNSSSANNPVDTLAAYLVPFPHMSNSQKVLVIGSHLLFNVVKNKTVKLYSAGKKATLLYTTLQHDRFYFHYSDKLIYYSSLVYKCYSVYCSTEEAETKTHTLLEQA